MSDPSDPLSPFHHGERAVQTRYGVRDDIEAFARKVVRDHMPDQHIAFYENLEMVIIGCVNGLERPWATLLAGPSGFMSSPDPRTLRIDALPTAGDPFHRNLAAGTEIGILGIDLAARRRNRLTGTISAVDATGFTVAIRQTFGNCPQYIQARGIVGAVHPPGSQKSLRTSCFNVSHKAMLERSDTIFIASAFFGSEGTASYGADVSHRGGKPGFVRVEDSNTILIPDYSGNNHFNTVGNLVVNPKMGLLVPDFDTGHILHATGDAEIVWDGAVVGAFTGAQRLIRFTADEVICIEGALPYTFRFDSYSGDLERTGSWAQAEETVLADQRGDKVIALQVTATKRESDTVMSLWLERADQKPLPDHQPGQFLPIRLTLPGHEGPVDRTYTISNPPGGNSYRLSIKDEGEAALVSPYLHAFAKPGFEIGAMAPRGAFVLDQDSARPAVFISAGIGITPMIAMAEHIALTDRSRPVVFLHGARNTRQAAFLSRLEVLGSELTTLQTHIRFSQGNDGKSDPKVSLPHSLGRIDQALLAQFLPEDEADYYLCGPTAFMRDTYASLCALGVDPKRMRYEAFGPATVIGDPAVFGKDAASGPVGVRFSATGKDVEWTPESGTLLDLALASGLEPDYACRSGVCGTCAARVSCGAVAYIRDPVAAREQDKVLLCCAVPRASNDEDGCGPGLRLNIDL